MKRSTAATVFVGLSLIILAGWANAKRLDAAVNAQQGGRDEIRVELSNNGFSPSEVHCQE